MLRDLRRASSRVARGAVRRQHTVRYTQAYERSLATPQDFWAEQAQRIEWFRPWDQVLDESAHPIHKWFAGGQMNTSYNALDVHVAMGNGDKVALRYDSPLSDTKRSLTYKELLEQVSTFAGGLQKLGVTKGDRVLIYMPAVVECAVAMLACARLGAIHTVVFGGFAAGELAARIDDATPKVIVAASCGIEPKGVINYEPLLNEALERASHHPAKCVVYQRDVCRFNLKKDRDIDWNDLMAKSSPVDAVPVLATDPLYILYTSGTTGKPKGVVRDNGGHAVALKFSMANVMDTHAGETFWAASDMGWVVGHSYIVYGPLLQGCTSVIYEGKPVGTPDAAAYWRVVSEYGVKTMFTAPTALRAIRKADPDGELMQSMKAAVHETLRAMFVAGERGDPKTLKFFADKLEVPIVDNWWQTETGWPMSSQCLGIEQDASSGSFPGIKFGSVSRPVPGYNIQLLSAEKHEDDHHHGHLHDSDEPDKELVVKLPLPPGTVTTLYNNEDEFHAKYLKRFPGYYHTGDTGHIDEDGYVYVMSRTDDVINVAGHRLCTGSIEEVIQVIPEVVECAVFGASDPLKGHVPVALLVLRDSIERTEEEVVAQVISEVREHIGSFACLKSVAMVPALPKTRSGKVMRATISAIAESRPFKVPATIENEAVLGDIRDALQKLGYAEKDSLIK